MTKILCIETSAETCSVALSENGICIYDAEASEERAHAKQLTVLIAKLLTDNKLETKDLDAIAISEGPGSYTGLRIGVSAAKGLCYGSGKPLIAIPTLQILTNAYLSQNRDLKKESIIIPMMDARRMEVYYAKYDMNLNEIHKAVPLIIDEASLNKIIEKEHNHIIGSGAQKCIDIIQSKKISFAPNEFPHAKYMARLAQHMYTNQKYSDMAYFEPAYLKPFIATISKKDILH